MSTSPTKNGSDSQGIKHKPEEEDSPTSSFPIQPFKKSRFSHLYEPIQRSTPPPGTPPVEGQQYLTTPFAADIIGVSFSAGQVFLLFLLLIRFLGLFFVYT